MATQMFPVLVVENPAEAAIWYKQHLGFETVAGLGWYEHLRHDDCELGFMAPGLHNQPEALRVKASAEGFVICFELEDLDTAWAGWGSKQEVVLAPTREEWGQYHFIVKDNAGLLVDLIQAEDDTR